MYSSLGSSEVVNSKKCCQRYDTSSPCPPPSRDPMRASLSEHCKLQSMIRFDFVSISRRFTASLIGFQTQIYTFFLAYCFVSLSCIPLTNGGRTGPAMHEVRQEPDSPLPVCAFMAVDITGKRRANTSRHRQVSRSLRRGVAPHLRQVQGSLRVG